MMAHGRMRGASLRSLTRQAAVSWVVPAPGVAVALPRPVDAALLSYQALEKDTRQPFR